MTFLASLWRTGSGFDDVIASLVLHYLGDWTAPLAELRRVLTSGSRLIVVVDHPYAIHALHREAGRKTDYFATYNWTRNGPWAAARPR